MTEREPRTLWVASLIARYFEARGWSMWDSEDPTLNKLRSVENEVYGQHRANGFTEARLESIKAVVLAAMSMIDAPTVEEQTYETETFGMDGELLPFDPDNVAVLGKMVDIVHDGTKDATETISALLRITPRAKWIISHPKPQTDSSSIPEQMPPTPLVTDEFIDFLIGVLSTNSKNLADKSVSKCLAELQQWRKWNAAKGSQ